MSDKGLQTSFMLGIAALFLGQALQANNGFLSGPALVFLTIALVFTSLAVISLKLSFPPVSRRELLFILIVGLVWQIIQLLTRRPFLSLPGTINTLWLFKFIVAVGAVSALLSITPRVWANTKIRRAFILVTFLAVFAAGVWVIRTSPDPFIDVYMFQKTSSKALIAGHNPYELSEPVFYEDTRVYGPELMKDGRLTIGNPYPPLSIYLALLGDVIGGDVRYSHLVAILLTGVIIAGLGPNRYTLLAAYIFLFTPRVYFVLDFSWTEPFVLLFAVAVIWCAIHRPAWTFVAFGLLIASKQYMLAFLPLMILLFPTPSSLRYWIKAVGQTLGVAFLVTAPLAFWNFQSFIWNVVSAQFYQPFRPDALSYAVIYKLFAEQTLPSYIPFLILGAALLLLLRFGQRSPLGFVSAIAVSLMLFFVTNKQAFFNYYFLVLGLLCCTLAITFVNPPEKDPESLRARLQSEPTSQ